MQYYLQLGNTLTGKEIELEPWRWRLIVAPLIGYLLGLCLFGSFIQLRTICLCTELFTGGTPASAGNQYHLTKTCLQVNLSR